jgi:hypothetical protein
MAHPFPTVLEETGMARDILGVVAGLAGWMAIAGVAGLTMRSAWPEYASVADTMTFTLPMMFARLAIGALATLGTGWITTVVARRSILARVTAGLLLVVVFVPQHVILWDKFPVWYHVTFLGSLVPLAYLGGQISAPRQGAVPQSVEMP